MRTRPWWAAAALLYATTGWTGEAAPLDLAKALNESKKCGAQKTAPSVIECSFALGNSLRLIFVDVGSEWASVLFDKADGLGDYTARYSVMSGCVVVKDRSLAAIAFINPRSAVVYSTWPECRASVKAH